jgi:Na+-driven multidrug efflux pump
MVKVNTIANDTISTTDLFPLYTSMADFAKIKTKQFNIEGAIYNGENWFLFNRGNGKDNRNVIFTIKGKDLVDEYQIISNNYKLPKINGFQSGFSDAVLVGDKIYFLATAENSKSTTEDGRILGIVGAAIGTIVSRFVMLGYMHYVMQKKEKFIPFFKGFDFKKIKKDINLKIIRLGAPSAMQMFFEVGLFTGAILLSGNLGTTTQAANQIALSLASFTFMFAMGLSVAAMIRVANQKGIEDYNKLRIVARSIFLLAILLEIVFALIFVVFHQYLPALFVDMENLNDLAKNTEVIIIASQLLLVAAVFQISDGIQVVVLGALRGLQDVKIPMYIAFVSYWVIGFPISIYFGLYTELKAAGIWIGLLAGLTSAAIFLYLRFNYLTKKLITQNA